MERFKADPATMNALYDTLGTLVLCLSAVLQPAQKAALSAKLAERAKSAEDSGDTLLETMLIDLHRASRL